MDDPEPGSSRHKNQRKKLKVEEKIDALPFIPECEILHEGGPDSKQLFDSCEKNPGHRDFIPVDKLTIEDLPQNCRSEKAMTTIKECCDRTVKISVKYTSRNRPDTYPNSTAPYPYSDLKGSRKAVRCGTGVIYYVRPSLTKGKPCPCHPCKTSGSPEMEFVKVEVFTAAHVIFDDSEAENTVCELFYDSDERDNVKYLYGAKGVKNGSGGDCSDDGESGAGIIVEKCTGDKFFFQCVTHDLDLVDVLQSSMSGIYSQYYGSSPLNFIVSHPHGLSKCITFGKVQHYTVQLVPNDQHSLALTIPVGTECRVHPPHPFKPLHSELFETLFSFPLFEYYKTTQVGTKCRVHSLLWFLSHGSELFEKLSSSHPSFEMYKTKQKLHLHIPQEAPYGCEMITEDGNFDWMKFPPPIEFSFPSSPKFYLNVLEFFLPEILDGKYASFFMTYDMDTCAGSSGAQVVVDNERVYPLDWATHHGSLLNGKNRSGINKHYLTTSSNFA